mgnify:CR=1 FL=1
MEREAIIKALGELKAKAKRRKFVQTVDLIVNLKNLELKKPEHQVDLFVTLPNGIGRAQVVCALVGPELKEAAEKVCEKVIPQEDFERYARNKSAAKALARRCEWFVGQANLMPKIAAAFGRVLGPRGKMPNPKIGAVLPPKADLAALHAKLQKTVRMVAKTAPLIQIAVGKEDFDESALVENISEALTALKAKLPMGEQNIRSVYIKLTMSEAVKVR